jgi:hypothetical protein
MPYCEEPTRSVDADAEEADAEDEEALPEEVTAVVETYVITIGLYPGAVTTPLLMIV